MSASDPSGLAAVTGRVLENGLVLVSETAIDNDIVAFMLHMHVGSLYEEDHQAGLSRLMARMLLKGAAGRTATELALELESMGASLTTSTGQESGGVALVCPLEAFPKAFDVLLDILTEPALPPDELDKEKRAAIGSIRARRDHLLSRAIDHFDDLHYGTHPFHKPAVGHVETVEGIARADVEAQWRRLTRTGNMAAALVGRVEADAVVERLEERLRSHAGGRAEPAPGEPPERAGPTESTLGADSQTAWIVAGWPAPSVGAPDSTPMAMLAAILGGSMDSRLFTELRDKRGLAYEIGSQYRAYAGPSTMVAYMGTAGDQYEVGRDGLVAEVERLRSEGPTADEIERTRNHLRGAHVMSMERNSSRATSYGVHELFGLGYDYPERFLAELARTTRDDLMRVAETWWCRYTVAAVVPERSEAASSR